MKKLILPLLGVLLTLTVKGQQNPTVDNYLFNPISIAPSLSGHQTGMFQTIYDAQWIGLKGAPRTSNISYDHLTPQGFGLNINLLDDKVGPMSNQHFALSTSYHLQVSKESHFAVGIRYSLNHTSVDFTDEFYVDKLDNEIYNIDGPWFQNVDLSATYYNPVWYAGATVKNMVHQELYAHNYTAQIVHLYSGVHFDYEDWRITPSVLINVTENTTLDGNYHVYGEYQKKWGIGMNLSPGDEIGMFTMVQLPANATLFYQYNYPLSELVYITKQSHVIGLGLDIFPGDKTIVSPRYFL
jgi:type IX secretion system PorP/SprF family membrane protein